MADVLRPVYSLILAVVVLAGAGVNGSRTPPVYLAHRVVDRPYPCEDGRLVKVYLLRSGKLQFKNEAFDRERLGARLDEIFRTRAAWLLFLGADPKVPLKTLADTIAIATEHVDYVALITPSVENSRGCMTVSLPPNFKDHSR